MPKAKTLCRIQLASLLLLIAAAPALAQQRGVVLGRITDSSGAPVPDAEVSLLNSKTGISVRSQSGNSGEYTFTNLEPGVYEVTASHKGFQTAIVHNVSLFVGDTIRKDLTLSIGSLTTKVEVTASAPVVQSESSSVGSVVDGHQVATMPLNGRTSIYGLLALAPGVQSTGSNPMISGGGWYGSTNMTVDGVTNNDVGNERLLGPVPSLDAIGEFKVIANGASAEYGKGGAQVVVATKSGTNEYHGSLFAYNRNRALSAKNFFATGLPKPSFNRNEFGGSLGGAIIRNKLFYFGSYEGLRQRVTDTDFLAMPTVALKSGDFTNLAAIKDPLTGAPFPQNRIPTGRISPVSTALLKFATDPNGPGTGAAGLGNNLTVNVPTAENMDRYSGRLDYQASSADRFTGRAYLVNDGPFSSASGGTDKYGNWGGTGITTRNVLGSYTRVVSPTMINEVRFGYTSEIDYRTPQNSSFDPSTIIPGLTSPLSGLGGLPTVSITGFYGFNDKQGSSDSKASYEAIDLFTWVHARHTIKFGFNYEHTSAYNRQNANPYRGSFTFVGRYSGNAFADFLLGDMSASGRVNKNAEAILVDGRYAGFVQDDWNVSPRLTLNLGLRYEYQTPKQNDLGDWANFYPGLGKIVLLKGTPDPRLLATLPIVNGQDVGLNTGNYINPDRNNFAPRIGFAFRPLGTTRLVVRSSYGIYYNVVSDYGGNGYIFLPQNAPFLVSETFEPTPGPIPSLTFANPFPGNGNIPTNPSVNAIDRNVRDPYQQQWNFTVESEVMPNTAVRISYLGNKGTHLEQQFNLNDPAPQPGQVQPNRPYQPFGSIRYYQSGRDSITHQLQVGAVRRLASGVAFQVEYQFTRGLGPQIYGVAPMDNRNTRLDRGNLDFIRRHYLESNYIYDH